MIGKDEMERLRAALTVIAYPGEHSDGTGESAA